MAGLQLLATVGGIAASVLELHLRHFALHKRDVAVLAWVPTSRADGRPWASALRRRSRWCSLRSGASSSIFPMARAWTGSGEVGGFLFHFTAGRASSSLWKKTCRARWVGRSRWGVLLPNKSFDRCHSRPE